MNYWLSIISSTLLFGVSGALLWVFIMMTVEGKLYFHEPNALIFWTEIVVLGLCMAFALFMYGRAVRPHVKKLRKRIQRGGK